jgi:hypothetical protein
MARKRKPKKIATVHVRPVQRPPSESKPTVPAFAPLTSTGGELGLLDLDVAGLSGVLLELAGERAITLTTALSVWQREQDRISNRSWRRPGGLVRFPGVF